MGDCERWRPLSACVRPACIDSPAHTRPLRTYLPAPNSFRIHTSEKCPKSRENRHSKPFRIRTCKHLYLQVLWNPHLQKYRGEGYARDSSSNMHQSLRALWLPQFPIARRSLQFRLESGRPHVAQTHKRFTAIGRKERAAANYSIRTHATRP